jgi:hypothetical protein
MKKILIIFLSIFLFISSAFSQEHVKQNCDSLWYFHPFTTDHSAGIWTPIGKLSKYYKPSLQFGLGLGLMVSSKMRFQLWIMPRVLTQKNPILLNLNDSDIEFKKKSVGGSFGGWLSYTFYQDRILSTEILTGITWENIPTNIMKANNKDTLSISGLGLSIGINSWFNTFHRLNFGLRAIYTYSTFDKSKYLASPIGGHLLTFSLVYRSPRRSQEFKKWY